MEKESVKAGAIEKKGEVKAGPSAGSNPAYKASELAAQARQLFGATPEVVAVALKVAGKEAATVSEAKETVNKFLEREVK